MKYLIVVAHPDDEVLRDRGTGYCPAPKSSMIEGIKSCVRE